MMKIIMVSLVINIFQIVILKPYLLTLLDFKKPSAPNPAFVVGGYFHTCILEPDKLDKYKVVKSSTRNQKCNKEAAGEDICC